MGQSGNEMNKAVDSHGEFGQKLIKVLGLEGQQVYSITMEARVGQPVSIQVERFLSKQEALEMTEIFDEYNLVKKEENAVDDK